MSQSGHQLCYLVASRLSSTSRSWECDWTRRKFTDVRETSPLYRARTSGPNSSRLSLCPLSSPTTVSPLFWRHFRTKTHRCRLPSPTFKICFVRRNLRTGLQLGPKHLACLHVQLGSFLPPKLLLLPTPLFVIGLEGFLSVPEASQSTLLMNPRTSQLVCTAFKQRSQLLTLFKL